MIEIGTTWREAVPAIVAMAAVAVNNQLVHKGELAADRRRSQCVGNLTVCCICCWCWHDDDDDDVIQEDDQEKDYYAGEEVGAEIEAAADSFILPLLVLLLMQLGLAISGVMVRTPLILELRLFLSFTLNIIEYHLITVSSSYHSNIVRVSSLLVAFLCWWFMVWQLSRLVDCRGFWPLRLQRTSPKS